MKYLALDYGEKRVGVAVSDADGRIAFPRASIVNSADLVARVCALAADEHAEGFIVGDTLSHGGARNPVSDASDAFVSLLKSRTELPVERAHEAWSSVEASRYAPKDKQHEDAAAAAVILQRYLDIKNGSVE
ncbi:Holliday junction resolvase RuvX [Candidatus Kaiserbacteria bacterium]|nr:Holliday junction resolvase RuvX [Candidatus Kaiserbacteria bacterium]